MSELTFKGFLTKYVKQLSYSDTNNVIVLAIEAGTNNYRLREPLLLYAICFDKVHVLLRAFESDTYRKYRENFLIESEEKLPEKWFDRVKDDDFAQTASDFLKSYDKEAVQTLLEEKSDLLSNEFHKCWRSYVCDRDANLTRKRRMEKCREKVLKEIELSGVTQMELCKNIGVNSGGLSAWLKHGKPSISEGHAIEILRYLRLKNYEKMQTNMI